MNRIVVSDIHEIGGVLDYVHDRIFQLSKLKFDNEKGILSIPLTVITDESSDHMTFLFFNMWKNPVVEAVLVINNVVDYRVRDEALIDEGSINTITMEDDFIRLKCSVPVEIDVRVSSVVLELIFSDSVVSKVTRFSFGRSKK